MTQFPPPIPGPSSMIPPVEPGQMNLGELPSWPKVIGIISIVWGGLGLFCSVCGIVMAIFQQQFLQWAAQQDPNAASNPAFNQPPPGPLSYAAQFLGIITGSLLVFAGIQTLRRRALGRTLHLVYGAAGLIVGVITMIAVVQQSAAATAAIANDNSAQAIAARSQQQVGMVVGLICGGVLGFVYPLFSLVWFGLIKTKHVQMTGGMPEEQLI